MINISERIKELRLKKGWTQKDVAEKLNITQAGYQKLESNDSDITFSRLNQIAEVFEMPVVELIGDASQMYNALNNAEIEILKETNSRLKEEVKKLRGEVSYLSEIRELQQSQIKNLESHTKKYDSQFLKRLPSEDEDVFIWFDYHDLAVRNYTISKNGNIKFITNAYFYSFINESMFEEAVFTEKEAFLITAFYRYILIYAVEHLFEPEKKDKYVINSRGAVSQKTRYKSITSEKSITKVAEQLYDSGLNRVLSKFESEKLHQFLIESGLLKTEGLVEKLKFIVSKKIFVADVKSYLKGREEFWDEEEDEEEREENDKKYNDEEDRLDDFLKARGVRSY
ncbi:MAG: helix-turn-helix domain-containing protein [Thermoflexibacter sp.]|jgi:transcriptional regulator with XRE-family HTH domain|nr:helix-turn-helix domain-containing protein [Thermoflexibacter sp.]